MIRLLSCLLFIICLGCTAFAQDSTDRPLLEKAGQKAANSGGELATQITVRHHVNAQAVLIPRVDARRIFGKEIADNYAVIEVNVGNKSGDAALIIHSIFIDYSRWALKGGPPFSQRGIAQNETDLFQASTKMNQVASEEYRVVRGQLLDAQSGSKRNWTMRLLTLAGNLAGGYAFAFKEEGILRGLNSFSGIFVPGIKEVWPDGTIEQLNRVSDFGFQANKVIPKQGSEIIVCFFPIDRFLTPGFKKIFLKSPALFFAPLQMLYDRRIQKDVSAVVGDYLGTPEQFDAMRKALPCYVSVEEKTLGYEPCLDELGLEEVIEDNRTRVVPKTDAESRKKFAVTQALDFINRISLNSITVVVDGVMTVDTTIIPAKIDGIAFDAVRNCGADDSTCFWADLTAGNGVRTGTIPGSYLTGGNVVIAEAVDQGITELKTISEGSSDQVLHFSFKLTKAIEPDTRLHFTIAKPKPGASGSNVTIDSSPWEYRVGHTPPAPTVTDVKQNDKKLTIKGTHFYDVPPTYPLVVKLHPPFGDDIEVKPTSATASQLEVTIPDDGGPAGCWTVMVNVGALSAPRMQTDCFCFLVEPKPELESAVRKDNTQIVVTGTDLIDTRLCGGKKLSFQLQKDGGTPIAAKILGVNADGKLILELPAAAKEGAWNLQVLLGTEKKGDPVKLE